MIPDRSAAALIGKPSTAVITSPLTSPAARAGVSTLVLTHYVPPLIAGQEDQWRALAATEFSGRVELGDDLLTVSVAAGG